MISFNDLANLGRLGNQLFQYAALKGIAKNRGFDYYIPPAENAGQTDLAVRESDSSIYNTFKINAKNYGFTNYTNVVESTFNFDENLFNNCPENTNLVGYFQNEKYFEHIEDEIRSEFIFSDEIQKKCSNLIGEGEFLSLHIRRGDYLNNPNHPVQPMDYYEKALGLFDDSIQVLVFSDDWQWCHTQELFKSDRFLISENNATAVDLCLQSMCSYHIICNSSFSWWGSYLAKSKKTVAPKLWFAGSLLEKDTSNIYRKDWIVI